VLFRSGLTEWEFRDERSAESWGRVLGAVRQWSTWPGSTVQRFDGLTSQLAGQLKELRKFTDALRATLDPEQVQQLVEGAAHG
jgi:hypothetical protein